MLVIHILSALLGLISAALFVPRPSLRLERLAGGGVLLTAFSGGLLTIAHPAGMLRACAAGLAYLGLTAFLIAAGRKRCTGAKKQVTVAHYNR